MKKMYLFIMILSTLIFASITAKTQNTLNSLGFSNSDSKAEAAFSLRQLSTTYTAPLVRVTIGVNTYDVWPDIGGSFSMSSVISVANPTTIPGTKNGTTALSTVATGNTATIAIWYNQSGSTNDYNVRNITVSQQPRIINAGVIHMQNGKPSAFFIAANSQSLSSTAYTFTNFGSGASLLSVFSKSGTAASGLFSLSAHPNYLDLYSGNGTSIRYESGSTPTTSQNTTQTIVNNTLYQQSAVGNEHRLNGSSLLTGSSSGIMGSSFISQFVIGNFAGYWDGYLSELVCFATTLNATIRQVGESNQYLYYSTFSPPNNTGVSCWKTIGGGGNTISNHGIKNDGTVWGWGIQLPTIANAPNPNNGSNVPIQLGVSNRFSTFSKGSGRFILEPDGSHWAMKGVSNANGLLGDAGVSPLGFSIDSFYRPNSLKFKELYCDGRSAIGLKHDGTLWAWGDNFYGQLGIGSTGGATSTPTQVGTANNWKQLAVGGGENGAAFWGLKTDGTIWVWGKLQQGVFYVPNQFEMESNVPIQFGTESDWKSISGDGSPNHFAAIKNNGTLWVWSNTHELFGNGNTGAITAPDSIINAKRVGVRNDWMSVTVKNKRISALTTDSSLWVWGDNGAGIYGYLGDGTSITRTVPTQIMPGTKFKYVDLSAEPSFGQNYYITTSGSLFGLGNNNNGVLGDGTTINRFITPVPIACPSVAVSTNAELSAMTLSSGTLTPAFAAATIAYTASVPNATTSITVTPTKANANATIEVRVNSGSYAAVASGSPSSALSLNVGANTIDVKVTAQDGTTIKTYTTTVTRAAPASSITTSVTSLTAFTSCSGVVSAAQNFTVGGSALTANLVVTAPTGFEVSTTAGSGYSSSVSLTPSSGTVATTTIYARLSTTATGSPAGNIACTSTGATTINIAVTGTVTTTPTPTISGATAFCSGGSVTLTSSAASGNQWYKDAVLIGSATNTTYSATTAGVYTVIATVSGCVSPLSATKTITINPLPATPVITNLSPTSISGNTNTLKVVSPLVSHQWVRSDYGGAFSTLTLQTKDSLVIDCDILYNSRKWKVIATDINGCSATSNELSINSVLPTGVYGGTFVAITTPAKPRGADRVVVVTPDPIPSLVCAVSFAPTPINENPTSVKLWLPGSAFSSYARLSNYVANRHFEIVPTNNNRLDTVSGTVNLYYTQADFNNFNTYSDIDLPSGPTDSLGKANLRIMRKIGISSNGSGLPSTYSGATDYVNPIDSNIRWIAGENYWEVKFNVTGFGGFFLTTENAEFLPPGNTLNFDGNNDYVQTAPLGSTMSTNFTIETWVMPKNATSTMCFLSTREPLEFTFDAKLDGGNKILVDFGNGISWGPGNSGLLSFDYNYTVNKWMHIAIVVSGTNCSLYVNGLLIATKNIGLTAMLFNTTSYLKIGSVQGLQYFNGNIDEVRLWNVSKSQAQIQASFYDTVATNSTGLIAYYRFDAGTAGGTNTESNTASNWVGGSLLGTLYNFALTGSTSNWVESYAMAIPTATAATSTTATGFTANWTAPIRGTVDNGYRLEVSTSATFATQIAGSPFTVNSGISQAVTGLTTNTIYYYRVVADKTSVTGQGGYSNAIAHTLGTVPLKIVSFTAIKKDNNALLKWVTENEVNTNFTNVEFSKKGLNWEVIGKVKNNNSTNKNEYSFTHLLTNNYQSVPTLFYRLQQVDIDGKYSYSEVRTIKQLSKNELTVYPNPVTNGKLNIDLGETITKAEVYSIATIVGKIVQQGNINNRQQTINIGSLSAGIYLLKVGDRIVTKIVIE